MASLSPIGIPVVRQERPGPLQRAGHPLADGHRAEIEPKRDLLGRNVMAAENADAKKAADATATGAKDAGKAVGSEAAKVGEGAATDAKDAAKAVDGEAKKVGEDVSDELKKLEGKDKEPKPTPKP